MEDMLDLIQQYGLLVYLLLFGYCALKSGWLPLFAGYAAHTGALDVGYVALAAFMGGYLGDELRFALARTYGTTWLEKPNRLGRLFKTASELANRYGTAYIFLYRYPKGLRTIGALPIGLTSISWRRFSLLNACSALAWVVLLVGGGFTFGATFDSLGVENLTALSLLFLCVFLFTLYRLWNQAAEVKTHQQ
ncbi:VTT domain-containing protein [Pseudoalteromonas sp. APC 3224]|uniref:DedA family protein n=1 Tax=Pseudoalteromonas sp. APC 3224 TaxID=3035203 RepID=UPI0025B3F0BE|nr:VTT domain-containing protein [Pseudoalteromonas sp. APC 3224]MDN3486211.1 VTT domain-containing protein [Pseudoalteromonas sp. APC 3224]